MYKKYFKFAQHRNLWASLLAASVILSSKASCHLEIHADIPEHKQEELKKDVQEKKGREAFDRVERDRDTGSNTASDNDRSEAATYTRDYGS